MRTTPLSGTNHTADWSTLHFAGRERDVMQYNGILTADNAPSYSVAMHGSLITEVHWLGSAFPRPAQLYFRPFCTSRARNIMLRYRAPSLMLPPHTGTRLPRTPLRVSGRTKTWNLDEKHREKCVGPATRSSWEGLSRIPGELPGPLVAHCG